MSSVRLLFAALLLPALGWAIAPAYSLASVVNSATGLPGSFAPNSMGSIYGTTLAYETQAASAGQSPLPQRMAGVTVKIGGTSAFLFYVSPQQINFLIPADMLPGPVSLTVVREGVIGPILTITLSDAVPGFFADTAGYVIAAHADGRLITNDSPAIPDEVVVLYCAGLGRTNPDADPGRAPARAASIAAMTNLTMLLSSAPVDPSRILYAGVTPGFAGLYQINLQLPGSAGADPEIRVFIGQQGSPSFLKLSVRIQ